MKKHTINVRFMGRFFLLTAACSVLVSCSDLYTHSIPRLGTGGRYAEGREQFTRGRGGNMDKAVVDLEAVVRDNPTYLDSLTLLGRAYYRKGRYVDANQILQRALVVNKDDEIAWLVLGMTQLQLQDDDKGIETLKGAITMISKVNKPGYRNYPEWDVKGSVRAAISRSTVVVLKGPEAKKEIFQACDTLLSRMDDEESYQKDVAPVQYWHGLQ
ncbi:MAG TPA: tetratricopeptide repeat protein [Candidatus Binatia bacterium]